LELMATKPILCIDFPQQSVPCNTKATGALVDAFEKGNPSARVVRLPGARRRKQLLEYGGEGCVFS
jgi:hypothetical protein